MVSDQTRNMVWQEFLDVARNVRYYEKLSNRYRKYHHRVRFLILASAVSGIANLLDLPLEFIQGPFRELIQLAVSGFIALLVVWDFVADYGKKAEVLHIVSLQCSDLESQWDRLWAELHDEESDDTEIRRKNRRLSERLSTVTGWAGLVNVQDDEELNSVCEKDAYRVMDSRYDLSRSSMERYQDA